MRLLRLFLAVLVASFVSGRSIRSLKSKSKGDLSRSELDRRVPPPLGSLDTNAERLRRGLPLKAPKRRAPGDKRVGPSCVPQTGSTGMISVYDVSTSQSIGYVAATEDSEHEFTVTMDIPSALNVELMSPSATTPFSISLLNSDSTYGYLGAAAFGGDPTPGSSAYGVITGSSYTAPYSTATGNDDVYDLFLSESSVWTIDASLMLYLQYTDSNEMTYPATLFYDPSDQTYLGFTDDVSALAAQYPSEEFDTVTFTFVPTSC